MSFGETVNYLLLGNPISQAMISTMTGIVKSAGITPKESGQVVVQQLTPQSLCQISGGSYNFVRLAGICGATAIIMGAYGKHALGNIDNSKDIEARMVFDGAYRFHFLHTFALLGVPLARSPAFTGSLMTIGTLLFCCPMYYRAFTHDTKYANLSTYGGLVLIAAWLSFVI